MTRWFILFAVLLAGGPVSAHDWFSSEVSPDGRDCCSGSGDCAAAPVRIGKDGQEEIQLEGHWWNLHDPRWYLGETRDPAGAPAGCMNRNDSLPRCTWTGAGA